jgi:heptosyltransferase-2
MGKLSKTRSDLQFLVFGSRSEKNRISKLVDNQGTKVINLAGELSLRQSIIAISFCSLFISNDSGLMHIASSVMVPTVAIFGPTLPHKTAPLKQSIRVLYHRVDCAPCKHRECPLDHRCMKEIKVDDVLQQAISVLEDQHG